MGKFVWRVACWLGVVLPLLFSLALLMRWGLVYRRPIGLECTYRSAGIDSGGREFIGMRSFRMTMVWDQVSVSWNRFDVYGSNRISQNEPSDYSFHIMDYGDSRWNDAYVGSRFYGFACNYSPLQKRKSNVFPASFFALAAPTWFLILAGMLPIAIWLRTRIRKRLLARSGGKESSTRNATDEQGRLKGT